MSSFAIEELVARLPEAARTLPVPLLKAAPVVEAMIGARVHSSCLHRWAARGSHGVLLEVLRVGDTRMVTPRQLATFFVAAGESRPARGPSRRGKRRTARPIATERAASAPSTCKEGGDRRGL